MKVHRLRLDDEEIKAIADALRYYVGCFCRPKHQLPNCDFLEDLAIRFIEWGTTRPYWDRPLYRRRRRT